MPLNIDIAAALGGMPDPKEVIQDAITTAYKGGEVDQQALAAAAEQVLMTQAVEGGLSVEDAITMFDNDHEIFINFDPETGLVEVRAEFPDA